MATATRETTAASRGAGPRGPRPRARRAREASTAANRRRSSLPGPSPDRLIAAYAAGAFPMADPASGEIVWQTPDPRAVLPLDGLRVPSGLAKLVRSGRFEIRADTAFEAVVRFCAELGPRREEAWLDERLIRAQVRLHRLGLAHSLEAWRDGVLVGGLYGVAIGAAFFGESMFHRAAAGGSDASKVCLVALVERLRAGGFELLDLQYLTPHLERFGGVEIPGTEYQERLESALRRQASWAAPAASG